MAIGTNRFKDATKEGEYSTCLVMTCLHFDVTSLNSILIERMEA